MRLDGRCIRCGDPSDRAGVVVKGGREAALCSNCLALAEVEKAAARAAARALIMDMERALGMPVLGVGGKGIR